MKTVLEWLKTLPKKQSKQAIANTSHEILRGSEKSLSEALLGAFAWDLSTEGNSYWLEIYKKVLKEEKSKEEK